jgi:hypothetical protein
MPETLKLAASEYIAVVGGRVRIIARARDGHWWAGVGLYLWTAFLFGNVMSEIWHLYGQQIA